MGRVLTELIVENLEDIWRARSGQIREDEIQHITVPDAWWTLAPPCCRCPQG